MVTLTENIASYEEMQRRLERNHLGKWVVVCEKELAGVFDNFQSTATMAVVNFGSGPYLIREVGEGPVTLPASILYQPVCE